MEPSVFTAEVFRYWFTYLFVVPTAIRVAAKGITLDGKLDPEEGEDETRLLFIPKQVERGNNVECERAIIAVDGEGMDAGPETIIERDGGKWPDHGTILLGAGGVGFAREDGGAPSSERRKALELPTIWLGHEDKRFLDGIEAIEFYLPDRYPNCYYVMFSFNYDVTMLLKRLRQGRSEKWHYERVIAHLPATTRWREAFQRG